MVTDIRGYFADSGLKGFTDPLTGKKLRMCDPIPYSAGDIIKPHHFGQQYPQSDIDTENTLRIQDRAIRDLQARIKELENVIIENKTGPTRRKKTVTPKSGTRSTHIFYRRHTH